MIRSVAITGATGFIGRHVAADLAARGVAVTSIVRPASRHKPPPDSTVVYAPLEAAALRGAFAGQDAVVHLAGVVNTEGTRAAAEAARDAGARLVHVSSLAAAGPAPASAPLRETDPPKPVTPYGFSKLESERIVAGTRGLHSIILRPGVVYGPTDRAVFPLFKAAQAGVLPLVGRAGAAYAFIHVDDVVRAIVSAVEKTDVSGAVFVAHETPVTSLDLIDAIQAAVGRKGRVVRIPMPLTHALALAGDVVGRVFSKPMTLSNQPVSTS